MDSLLLYALPALAFLFAAGLAVGALSLWSKRFSKTSKALTKRLAEVSEVRHPGGLEALVKRNQAPQGGFGRLLEKLPGFENLKLLVIRSGTDKSAQEILGLSLLAGVVSFFLLAVSGLLPALGALLVGVIATAAPVLFLVQQESRRLTQFESQLPEALDFLSRALRAGHGLTAGLAMVGDELEAPVGTEFKTAFDEINFGLPFNDAMSNMAARVNSQDLNFFVVALLIQRETGGNLAELLENLAKTVRERMKLMGKVKVISAEGRLSGIVISSMPFVMAVVMTIINPRYMNALWTTPSGHTLITVGLGMMAIGIFWISKVVKVKV
jgi:tight adherence protein B